MIREKLYHLGEFLVERLRLDQAGKGNPELEQELQAISNGSKTAVRDYYVQKVLLVLAVLAGGLVLTLICFLISFFGSGRISRMETVSRPGYGENDRRTALSVQVDDEEEVRDLEVTLHARRYTDKQKQQMLDKAMAELDAGLLGENVSADFVQTKLNFPTQMRDGLIGVCWSTDPAGVIDSDGSILEAEEEGTLVGIRASLSCGELEEIYSCSVRVFPPDLTEDEQLMAAILQKVEQADEEHGYESELVLPGSVEGRKLTWVKVSQNPALSVLAFTLILAACLYLEMDSRIHDKARKRKDQLLLDYPDLMWKMTMLLGAGMSLHGVFMRISREYSKGQRKIRPRYVYEEVMRTCTEMKSGIGEAQAYERFGRRCQLPSYIRIGSILSQNLRKGAKGLAALLESEAEESLNDRKAHARQIGEQAGTKLLLPMGVMLIIVLAVLMVPAFLSF